MEESWWTIPPNCEALWFRKEKDGSGAPAGADAFSLDFSWGVSHSFPLHSGL